MKTRRQAVILLRGITLAVALSMVSVATLWADSPKAAAPPPSMAAVQSAYGHLPLSFEANQGQTDTHVQFLSRGRGHQLFLTPSEAVLALRTGEASEQGREGDVHQGQLSNSPPPTAHSVVRMTFDGANPHAEVVGLDQLPGIVNYFIGADPSKWRTNIPTYKKVEYKNVYAGIDLVYYGNQGQLEYDLIVAPGADLNLIRLVFDGAEKVAVDPATGDLVLTVSEPSTNSELRTENSELAAGTMLRLYKPVVYQMGEHGDKHLLAGTYVFLASETSLLTPHVAFQVAAYDASKPLIIDPMLSWATYLGGSGTENPQGIAVDTAGNAYVTGYTNTPGSGFPGTAGSLIQSTNAGGTWDVFVAKLNAAGTALVYSTYLGGSGQDLGQAIAVDTAGRAYVTGYTDTPGSGFPGTAGSFIQSTNGGGQDAFVAKLNAAGTALVYSTYLGGSGSDQGWGIAVDTASNAYVTGFTNTPGSGFPGTAGSLIQSTYGGGSIYGDAFVTKLNAAGTALVYSTYLGGSGDDAGYLNGIAVDTAGNAYVTGFTTTPGSGFPGTAGSLIQSTFGGGGNDAFVTKLNAAGTALVYSTYLGGSGGDASYGIAVDTAGQAYVAGSTTTPGSGFPGTAGSLIQNTNGGGNDAFVTKLNAAGTALVYSTYLGASGDDQGRGIAVDQVGQAYVTGYTDAPGSGFPGTAGSSLQSTYGGGIDDAFVTKLNAVGTALVYSTYLGGSGQDIGYGIAVDTAGNAYVTGYTNTPGSGFPGTAGSSIQSTYGGGTDAFVAKISFTPTANAGPDQSVPEGTVVTLDGTGSLGGSLTYTWTQVPGLPTAVLSGATTAHPTFSAPHVPAAGGTVTFKLVVCEGTSSNCSDPDTINVHITNVNHPPVADAGPDQTVQEGSPVQLDGTASYDIDVEPLTYQWTQILGPAVTLVGGNTALPTFVAPSVGPAGATIVFDLTVTDPHTLTGPDSVSIHVINVNQIPVANAGPDQTVNENTLVTLNGTGSTDPDLDLLHFTWGQTAGPSVALTGGTTANPTFTAPSVVAGGTTLTFQLVVSDGQVSSAADTVNIHVLDTNDPPVCTLAQPSVASLWPPNHTMVPVSIMGVTDPNNQAITITYTAVTQDEPVNGLGDGDTSPDAAVSGNQILLRAERSGTGNGRVYAVHFTATDDQGASCSGTVKVSVPHSKKDPAGEGPQAFNSFTP